MNADRVLVVGDSMLDRYWEGRVERISPEAPVPVLCFDSESQRAGGAANVAMNLQALGSRTTLATLLGQDEAGDCLAQLLESAGVQLQAIRCAQTPTTQKIRAVCQRQQLLRVDIEAPAPDAAARALCDRVQGLLSGHSWVMLSDYHKGSLAHCARMIELAQARGCRVMIDPKGSSFEPYRGAWLLKPNEKEAAAVVGHWSDEQDFRHKMGALRAQLGLQHLLVTRGERGMALFSADRPPLHMATMAKEVFDVSGAGDTVLAALASSLVCGESLEDAVRHANLAAGIAVARFGTAVVSRADIQQAQSLAKGSPALAPPAAVGLSRLPGLVGA